MKNVFGNGTIATCIIPTIPPTYLKTKGVEPLGFCSVPAYCGIKPSSRRLVLFDRKPVLMYVTKRFAHW